MLLFLPTQQLRALQHELVVVTTQLFASECSITEFDFSLYYGGDLRQTELPGDLQNCSPRLPGDFSI